MSTATFLHSHGLQADADELGELIEEAVRELPQGLYRSDSSTELTREEVQALKRGGLRAGAVELGADDPLSRTTATYVALLRTSLTVHQTAERLGVSDGRIRQLLAERKLFGLKKGAAWRVPEFQLVGDAIVPGWEHVVAALDPRIHPVALFRWATSPNPDLRVGKAQVSPIAWLGSGGDATAIVDQAQNL